VRILQARDANGSKARRIGREDVAATGGKSVDDFIELLDNHWLVADIVCPGPIGKRVLVGRAGLQANGCTVQLFSALHTQRPQDYTPWRSVTSETRMGGADCRVTVLRHARVARQDIGFARIKSGKARLRVEGTGCVFVGISEGSCSDRTAQVD